MDLSQYVVRRANIDDLEGLKLFWDRNHLQILDLERRLTEFQLVVSPEGDLVGAMGLRVEGKQGVIHSEAYMEPEQADTFRPLLWDRVHNVARNLGLLRVWVDGVEDCKSFWSDSGFEECAPDRSAQLPAGTESPKGSWLVLSLRDESAEVISIQKEFEIFQQAQRAESEHRIEQARKLKVIALGVAVVVILLIVIAGFLLFLKVGLGGR